MVLYFTFSGAGINAYLLMIGLVDVMKTCDKRIEKKTTYLYELCKGCRKRDAEKLSVNSALEKR